MFVRRRRGRIPESIAERLAGFVMADAVPAVAAADGVVWSRCDTAWLRGRDRSLAATVRDVSYTT